VHLRLWRWWRESATPRLTSPWEPGAASRNGAIVVLAQSHSVGCGPAPICHMRRRPLHRVSGIRAPSRQELFRVDSTATNRACTRERLRFRRVAPGLPGDQTRLAATPTARVRRRCQGSWPRRCRVTHPLLCAIRPASLSQRAHASRDRKGHPFGWQLHRWPVEARAQNCKLPQAIVIDPYRAILRQHHVMSQHFAVPPRPQPTGSHYVYRHHSKGLAVIRPYSRAA